MRKILEYLDGRAFYILWLYIMQTMLFTFLVVWFGNTFQTFNCYIGDYSIMEIQFAGLQLAAIFSSIFIVDEFTAKED
jgi:hypothetical protein